MWFTTTTQLCSLDALDLDFTLQTPLLGEVEGQAEKPTIGHDAHRASRVAKQVASVANNGVQIGVGAHNMPGYHLHREMQSLWKGGMRSRRNTQ